jgi:small redox-active disulfide protein 2
VLNIKVLGTGCAKCKALAKNVRQAVDRLGIEAQISKVSNLDDILTYVMVTPALVINEKVKVSGRVASPAEIERLIAEEK